MLKLFNRVFKNEDSVSQHEINDGNIDLQANNNYGREPEDSNGSIEEVKSLQDERVTHMIRKERFDLDPRYEPLKKLGKGAYGMVISAKDNENDGEKVAIKKNINVFQNRTSAKRILREMKILGSLKHPNIVNLLDIQNPVKLEDFESIYLVMEYMQSDLHRVIYSENQLEDSHIAYITYQLLCGLKFIHSAGIYHRDLKPSNILINRECRAKICDFGLARVVDDVDEDLTQYVVTRWYRAPEVVLNERRYGPELDVWSVGCILAELFKKHPIFPGKDYSDQLSQIFNITGTPSAEDIEQCVNDDPAVHHFLKAIGNVEPKNWADVLPNATEDAIDLISKLLTFNPSKRITIDEALRHPFLAKYYNEDFVKNECVAKAPLDVTYEKMTREKDDIKRLMFEEIRKFRPRAVFPDSAEVAARRTTAKAKPANKFASMFEKHRNLRRSISR